MKVRENIAFQWPTKYWQSECAFADEMVTAQQLEWLGSRTGSRFVVATENAHLAAMLNPYLRRSQHMPGRV
jgi:hypothetical protein